MPQMNEQRKPLRANGATVSTHTSVNYTNCQHNFMMATHHHNLVETICDAYIRSGLQQATDLVDRIRSVLPFLSDKYSNAKNGFRMHEQLWTMLEQQTFEPKDSRLSVQCRRDGDRLTKTGDLAGALGMLNQAVMRAPPKGYDLKSDGGMQLALALWARSGVLLMRGNGQRALSDLLYAVECGLPAKQDAAYYLRQFWAHAMSGDKAEALVCLALCDVMCKDTEVRRGLAEHRMNIDMFVCQPKKIIPKEPLLTNGAHSLLIGVSSLLEVRTADGPAGRYVIAGQPIGTGDTLLVEQPLVSRLRTHMNGKYCLHCMRSLGAPVAVPYGCDRCSAVTFCSPACQRIACSTYHRYECRYGQLLIVDSSEMRTNVCNIALRAVTQCASVEEALRRCRQLLADLSVNDTRRSLREKVRGSAMAVFLTCLLKNSGFFGEAPAGLESTIGADELQVAAVLLGLCEALQGNNVQAITETRLVCEDWRDDGFKEFLIGVGVYKMALLFKHDCHPSVVRRFSGRTMVQRATRSLRTGEQASVSYGPTFMKQKREERQLDLQTRFSFRCECRSCVEDWPTVEKLNNRSKLRCPTANCTALHAFPSNANKQVKCSNCQKSVGLRESVRQVRRCEEQYRSAMKSVVMNNTLDAVTALAKAIDEFYAVAVAPHHLTQHVQTALQACLDFNGAVVACAMPTPPGIVCPCCV